MTRCVLLLVALASTALAGPLNNGFRTTTQCASNCPYSSKMGYESGKTYEYQYEANMRTTMEGATDEHSSLKLTAVVRVEVLDKCEFALQMTGVHLEDISTGRARAVDGERQFARDLERNVLRFGYQDGLISDVCPEEAETTWSLNVKRGFLSSLQNTNHDLRATTRTRETDVSGYCGVKYEIEEDSSTVTKVKKVKDMSACLRSHGHGSVFQSVQYLATSPVQSLPILKSSQECVQEFGSTNLILSTTCTEIHTLRPFSKGTSGATTRVGSSLTLNTQINSIRTSQDAIQRRTDLVMETVTSWDEAPSSDAQPAREKMTELCRATSDTVRPQVPSIFIDLVDELGRLDHTALTTIKQEASTFCTSAEEFFYDSLPSLRTEAAIQLMRDLIVEGTHSEMKTQIWLASIALAPHPTIQTIASLKELLTAEPAHKKTFLAVSTLIHTYCDHHPDCHEETAIQEIFSVLEDRLRYNCRATNEDRTMEVLMSLKAIGNIGHAHQLSEILERCVLNDDTSMELRVAAMNAFRRMPCESKRTALIDLMKNPDVDSELRINAYLMQVQCADLSYIHTVRDMLETEPINQMGSFVWTHLTNIKETASPIRDTIRHILEDIELAKVFDLDQRKFSRHLEWSHFNEYLNLGGEIEGNLIWSPSSFIPRSASVNLTVDMFGHSVNLVELGARVNGFDSMLEGALAGKDIKTVIDDVRNNRLEMTGDPTASYYVRLFGNDIRYEHVHLNEARQRTEESYDWSSILQGLAEGRRIDVTKNTMLTHEQMTFPTCAGLPLRLSLNGAASIRINGNGKLDLAQMWTTKSISIDGEIAPSAAVELTGEMGVDAGVAKSGLRMTSSIHTSIKHSLVFNINEAREISLDYSVPEQTLEVLAVKSQFFLRKSGREREVALLSDDTWTFDRVSGETFNQVTGLEAHVNLAYPRSYHRTDAPWFPFTGPAQASLTLEKKDSFQNYHFEAKSVTDMSSGPKGTHQVKILFNTPGSTVDREMDFDFKINKDDKRLETYLKTPWKKAEITGSVINTEDNKRLETELLVDDTQRYGFSTGLQSVTTGRRINYTPSMELVVHGWDQPVTLTGSAVYRENRKAEVDVSLNNAFSEPVTFKGELNKIQTADSVRYEGELEYTSPHINMQFTANGEKQTSDGEKMYSTRTKVQYQLPGESRQNMILNAKLKDLSNDDKSEYTAETAFTMSFWPRYNWDLRSGILYSPTAASLTFDGGLTRQTEKRIVFELSFDDKTATPRYEYEGRILAQAPFKEFDAELTGKYHHDDDVVHLESLGKYNNEQVTLDMDVERLKWDPVSARINIVGVLPQNKRYAFIHHITQPGTNEYRSEMTVTAHEFGGDVEIQSVYRKTDRHTVDMTMTVPEFDTPITIHAHVKPDVNDMNAELRGEYMNTVRQITAEWQHRADDGHTLNADFHWNMPDHTARLHGEGGSHPNSISANVNAELDGESYTAVFDVVKGTYEPNFRGRVDWNSVNYLEVSGDLKIPQEGNEAFYIVPNNVETSFSLTLRPQDSRNNIDFGLVYKHDWDGVDMRHQGEAMWSGDKIEVDMQNHIPRWTDLEHHLTINTPFEINLIKIDQTFVLSDNQVTVTESVQWNEKILRGELHGKLDVDEHLFESRLSLNTPFEGYDVVSANLHYNDDDLRVFAGSATAQWPGSNGVVGLVFNMNHRLERRVWSNNGDVTLTLLDGERKMTWDETWGRTAISSQSTITRLGETFFTYDLTANVRETSRRYRVESSFDMRIPSVDTYKATFSHVHFKQNLMDIETTGSVEWADKRISFENSLDIDPDSQYKQKLKFNSPFRKLSLVVLRLEAVKEGNTYTLLKDLKLAGNRRLRLDGTFNGESDFVSTFTGQLPFTSHLQLTTPYSPLESVRLESSMQNEGRLKAYSASLEYAPNKAIETTLKYDFSELPGYTYDFVLDMPDMPYIHKLIMRREQEFDEGYKFRIEDYSQIDWEGYSRPSTRHLIINTLNLEDISASMEYESPYLEDSYPEAKVIFTHKVNNARHTISTSSLEAGADIKWSASYDRFPTADKMYKSVSTYEIRQGQPHVVEVELDWSREGHIKMETEYTSSGNEVFDGEMELEYNGPIEYTSKGELMWEGSKYTVENAFNWKDDEKSLSIDAHIPEGGDEYAVNLEFHGQPDNFRANGVARVKDQTYTVESSFELMEDGVRTRITATNPNTYSFSYDVTGYPSNINSNANLNLNGETYELPMTFRQLRNGYSASVSVRTPHEEFRSGGISATYNNQNSHRVDVTVNTPFDGYEQVQFSVEHQGEADDFTTTTNVVYDGKRIEGQLQSRLSSRNNYEMTATLSTPYDSVRNVRVTTQHRWLTSKTGSLSATYNDRDIFAGTYELRMEDDFLFTVGMTAPKEGSVLLSHTADKTEGTVRWEDQTWGVTYEVTEENDGSMQHTVVITHPDGTVNYLTDYKITDGRITHKSYLQWGGEMEKIGYEIEGSRTDRSRRTIYDGNLKVVARGKDYTGTFYHKSNPGNNYQSEVRVGDLTLKQEIVLIDALKDFTATFTAQHPEFSRDVVLATQGHIRPEVPSIDGSGTLNFASEEISFNGKIADESSGSETIKYVAESELTHPRTNTDFKFKSSYDENEIRNLVEMEVTYMNGDAETKIYNTRAEIDKIRRELSFRSTHPFGEDVSLTAQYSDDTGNQLRVDGHVGDNALSGLVQLDREAGMEARVRYADKAAGIYAKKMTPSVVQFEMYREEDAEHTTDSIISVRMNTSRLIHGRLHIRPQMFDDMRRFSERDHGWNRVYNQVTRAAGNEYSAKKQAWKRVLRPGRNLLNRHKSRFNRMYDANDLYMKDIGEFVQGAGEYMPDFSDLGERMRSSIVDHDWSQYSPVVAIEGANYAVHNYGQGAYEAVAVVRGRADSMWQNIDEMANHLHQSMRDAYERMQNHPMVQQMRERFDNMPEIDIWRPARVTWNAITEPIFDYLNVLRVDFRDAWGELMAQPEMAEYKVIWDKVVSDAEWAYEYYNLEENLVNPVKELWEEGPSGIVQRIKTKVSDYLQLERTRVTVWGPGELQFEVFLPFHLRDFESLPEMTEDMKERWEAMRNQVDHYVPDNIYEAWDTIHRYKPSGDPYNWIPPFKGHATISGKQHFMTFDRYFYDYHGECSYVLARDTINNNFEVIVNYETVRGVRVRKSVSVNIDAHSVEISADKVLVDGRQSEMPVVFGDTAVRREFATVRVDSDKGVSVVCDLPHDRCTVNVTGWYFGKTGGLLGTYDNEPYTDFYSPDGNRIELAENLADAWASGSHCRITNYATDPSGEPSVSTREICSNFFESNRSPFRPCYSLVDPAPFMDMCLNDLMSGRNTIATEADTCDTAAFYTEECHRAGMAVRLPRACVSCQLVDGTRFSEHGNTTLSDDTVPKSADVVFVVSHGECNQQVLSRLEDMVDLFDKAMQARDLNDNMFGLIGYGGNGIYGSPHSHTMDGKLMNSRNKFAYTLSGFPIHESTFEDPLGALEMATKYPFRAGVSKTIVIIPCGVCAEYGHSYSDLQHMLVDREITLHTIMEADFRVFKSENPVDVFGIDPDTVYTRRDVGATEPAGQPDLRRQASLPKDLCAVMSDTTEGAVFDVDFIRSGRVQKAKKLMDVVAGVSAKKASPPNCQKCDCLPAEGTGPGMAVCRDCERSRSFFEIFTLPDLNLPEPEPIPEVRPDPPRRRRPNRRRGRQGRQGRRRDDTLI